MATLAPYQPPDTGSALWASTLNQPSFPLTTSGDRLYIDPAPHQPTWQNVPPCSSYIHLDDQVIKTNPDHTSRFVEANHLLRDKSTGPNYNAYATLAQLASTAAGPTPAALAAAAAAATGSTTTHTTTTTTPLTTTSIVDSTTNTTTTTTTTTPATTLTSTAAAIPDVIVRGFWTQPR